MTKHPKAKNDLPYPSNDGRTHYEGCWQERGHHNCAVLKIRELVKDREALDYLFKYWANTLVVLMAKDADFPPHLRERLEQKP